MLKDTRDAIPTSKAKTAYGLLRDVQRAILNEPKRADMECFVMSQDQDEDGTTGDFPACGTVGCFAGWVTLLAGANSYNRSIRQNAATVAMNILGSNLEYDFKAKDEFGYVGDWNYFNSGGGDQCSRTRVRTRAHARAVVNRINRFIRQNLKALKARKLTDGRREAGLA